MEVKNVYPTPTKRVRFLHHLRRVLSYVFIAAAIVCPVVNLAVGGKAWSLIVVWAVYTAACLIFTPLVEYNLIGQGTRLVINVAVLLLLIDRFLAPGWAYIAVPAIVSTCLLVLTVLLLSDLRRRGGNVLPLMLVLTASVVVSVFFIVSPDKQFVPMLVLGALSAVLLIAVLLTVRGRILLEIRKYFHTR